MKLGLLVSRRERSQHSPSGSAWRSQHCLHVGTIIVRSQEFGDLPARERPEIYQEFGGECITMIGNDMVLNFFGTSPREVAERA